MLKKQTCRGCGRRVGWFEQSYSIRGLVPWLDGEWHCRCWESWINGYEAGVNFAEERYEDARYPNVLEVFAEHDERRKGFMN